MRAWARPVDDWLWLSVAQQQQPPRHHKRLLPHHHRTTLSALRSRPY
jgi:hypothetical protein